MSHNNGMAVLMSLVVLISASSVTLAALLLQTQTLQAQQHRQWQQLQRQLEENYKHQQSIYLRAQQQ